MQQINRKYLACILFFLSILFFFRTIHYKPVWDDEQGHFTPSMMTAMDHDIASFWNVQTGMYIPLTYSTWGLIKRVASANGFKPAPFHLLNVITHGINSVLLFYLLLILFKNNVSAFWGSILFLIHPLQVESVAWISEFRGLYAAFFCLLSLLFFFNYLEKKQPEKFSEIISSKGFILSFLFFMCALLAKSTVVILPFIIIILVWRFYNGKMKIVTKSILLWLIPIFIVSSLILVKGTQVGSIPILQRLVIAGYTIFFYLQKLVVPYPLVACYGYLPKVVASNWFSYVALIISIGIVYFIIRKRKTFPDLFAAFLIVLVCILPVLGLIPFEFQKYSTVADRYMYLSFIGIALLMPTVVRRMQQNTFLKMCVGIILGIMAILTIKQTATWKDEFTLWNHTLTYFDNSSRTYYNRGVQYSLKGNFPKSISDYSRAYELDSTNVNVLFNRANAYENLKDFNAALNDYNTALKITPKDGELYYKRSNIYLIQMDLDKALDDVQRAEQYKYVVDQEYKQMLLNLKYSK